MNETISSILTYHQGSKHSFDAYAPKPEFLDWSNQPNPFRRYPGAPLLELPLPDIQRNPAFQALFSCERVAVDINIDSLSNLLGLSFGLAAWKQDGDDRWALRCNPSSGNLHPTEIYVLISGISALPSGLYHYAVHEHALEQRHNTEMPFSGIFIVFSSIYWREAWKYGERAYRYCQLDVGHAYAALQYAASILGWQVCFHDAWSDHDIAEVLGLNRAEDFADAETESPDLICYVSASTTTAGCPVEIDEIIRSTQSASWVGKANRLSDEHVQWPAIETVSRAAQKPRTAATKLLRREIERARLPLSCNKPAADIILNRRSTQAYDGRSTISSLQLYRMLDATLPHRCGPPFAAWPSTVSVHLVLFIHRVDGLTPGLYVFCRSNSAVTELRAALRPEFQWRKPDDCPDAVDFFKLVSADTKRTAQRLSCHQAIAANGAFSLGMIANLPAALNDGVWRYRQLYWEAGAIGQVLYLEAEAIGYNGTGIGCFFDDPVHEIFGIQNTMWQSLYHFTVGRGVFDARLQTLAPYAHLQRDNSRTGF